MKLIGCTGWGAIAGAVMAIIGGYAVAWAKHEWPFYQNYVASHATIDFTRSYGAPIGAVLGAMFGYTLERSLSRQPERTEDTN